MLFLRDAVGRLKLGFAVDQRDLLTVYGQWNSIRNLFSCYLVPTANSAYLYSIHLIAEKFTGVVERVYVKNINLQIKNRKTCFFHFYKKHLKTWIKH